jgi:hemerythrin-like metal-binding protein
MRGASAAAARRTTTNKKNMMPDKPPLPAELRTGVPIVDAEHRQLMELVGQLQTICDCYAAKSSCASCLPDKVKDCEQRLIACLSDILSFMLDHFSNEEGLLKGRLMTHAEKEQFSRHVDEHVRLIESVVAVTVLEDLQHTVRFIAKTAAILEEWLTEHIRRFDVPMLQ